MVTYHGVGNLVSAYPFPLSSSTITFIMLTACGSPPFFPCVKNRGQTSDMCEFKGGSACPRATGWVAGTWLHSVRRCSAWPYFLNYPEPSTQRSSTSCMAQVTMSLSQHMPALGAVEGKAEPPEAPFHEASPGLLLCSQPPRES